MPPVTSQKGKDKFVENGTTFTLDKVSSHVQTQYWRCDRRKTCKARIHVSNGAIIKRINEHTHLGDAAKVEVLTAVSQLKERALTTQDLTAQVVAAINLSAAGQGALQPIRHLKRTVQRQRVADLVIPSEYTRYEKYPGVFEDFLLYDSGAADGVARMLIFSTQRNMDILARSNEWFMDGTFDCAPPLFGQLYSIHARFLCRTHPLVFALLPNKRQETYEHLFNQLINIANEELAPENIITDYEMAAIQASHVVFPNSSNIGCFFHLSQSIHRRIQMEGLRPQYENDPTFALHCRMIAALAFVPRDDVVDVFDELSGHLPDVLQPVLDYFARSYIGLRRRGTRREPLFPIALWNMFERVLANADQTTNSVEAWHSSVQALLGEVRPTVWKFINGLVKHQMLRDTEIEQLFADNPPPRERKQYESLNQRVYSIVDDYPNLDHMDFLRGIAHNMGR